jgi:predicted MFS family arabinose efflux permease
MSDRGTASEAGYLDLLRGNPAFRHLFVGQIVSQTGDWFNSVAIFTLLLSLTGSGEAVGYILILKLLPAFFVGPLAGVVADRYDRKKIMIATDLLRGFLVLGFLFVDRPDQIWIVYTLTALEVAIAAFFDPARSAAIPSIVSRRELISANALSGASWSITLAVGAALGGVVTGAFGRDTAFVINALSFFVSAVFVMLARFPSRPEAARRASTLSLADAVGVTDIVEGARYLKSSPRVVAVLLVKSAWGFGGGVLLLLTIFGKQIFPIGIDGSTSIGLLYAARGLGAMIGPMIARRFTGTSPRTMLNAITASFFISALFYLLFAQASLFWVALLFVMGAHTGGSVNWVYSSTLLQMSVPNRLLGRVFAIEMALVTLTMAVSTYLTGWGLDYAGFSPRSMAAILGLSFLVPGFAYLGIQRWLNRDEPAESDRSSPAIQVEPGD